VQISCFFFNTANFFLDSRKKGVKEHFFWDEKIPRRGKGAGLRGEDVWGVWGGNEITA
jgi:hypothetical protein